MRPPQAGPVPQAQGGNLDRLPFSLKVLLENLLRGEDNAFVKRADVEALAASPRGF